MATAVFNLEKAPGLEEGGRSGTAQELLLTHLMVMASERMRVGHGIKVNAKLDDNFLLLTVPKGGDRIRIIFRQQSARSAKKPTAPASDAQVIPFLEQVYLFAESGERREASALVMERLDNLLRKGKFVPCARLLDNVEVMRLRNSPTVLLAFLGITLGAKDKLRHHREQFYFRAMAALTFELGADRAGRVLERFR